MQRTFVAIALALTLSCACATYIQTQNYVKAPTQVIQDNETNFTNATAITLASLNAGEVDIIAVNFTANNATPVNNSANTFSTVYRKLDAKTLSGSANTSFTFTSPQQIQFSNGYVVSVTTENDTNNVPQIAVYQTAVSGGKTVGRFFISSNNNTAHSPSPIAYGFIGKNIYVFYVANNNNQSNSTIAQVNVTSFTVGGGKGSLEFNLTTTYNQTGSRLSVTWGEALGSNQLYANWQEGGALKYSTIDVTKGTYNATVVGAWIVSNYTCTAFSTDKKWYGDLCYFTNGTGVAERTINYYARYNESRLIPLSNVSQNASTLAYSGVYPYGPYVAIFYTDSVTTQGNTTYSYDIINLDSLTKTKNTTTFLTTDLEPTFFRVVSGGLYTLTQVQNTAQVNQTVNRWISNIQVGLVLSGSYLTTVFGFIMTIVAAVLLF